MQSICTNTARTIHPKTLSAQTPKYYTRVRTTHPYKPSAHNLAPNPPFAPCSIIHPAKNSATPSESSRVVTIETSITQSAPFRSLTNKKHKKTRKHSYIDPVSPPPLPHAPHPLRTPRTHGRDQSCNARRRQKFCADLGIEKRQFLCILSEADKPKSLLFHFLPRIPHFPVDGQK